MFDYIIVQAGGKGSRMETLTRNRPKALVPVNNLPMIFHLFRKYSDKKFIIIGDYKYEVFDQYLHEFADVDYKIVRGTGHRGTCAGIADAIDLIPEDERFMLIWCDIVLPNDYIIPDTESNLIGISVDFFADGHFPMDNLKKRKALNMVWQACLFLRKSLLFRMFRPMESLFVGCRAKDYPLKNCHCTIRMNMA